MAPRLLHYSDLENVCDEPERAARLAGRLRELADDRTLVCGTGDDTSPGVLALVTRGEQSLDLFRAIDPDVETFGNHDFDYGPERTRDLVAASPQAWVVANVRDAATGERFGADVGVEPWRVFERDGDRIGVFGLTTPDTAALNPAATGLEFTDPLAAAADAAGALRDRGVDHVVALSHLGRRDADLAAAPEVPADVVLGGHTHSERVERIDGTLVARPGVNGRVVHEVDLGDRSVTRHETAGGAPYEPVRAALAERERAAGLDQVVARVDEPVARTEATCFRGESRIGNFVADAYRWYADADVALQNAGGIREGPSLSGPVTVGDLVSVVPFDGELVVAAVSGDRLRAAFAQAAGNVDFGEPGWWHAHVSGARIEYDHAADELVTATVGGEPIRDGRTYRLAAAEYVLSTTAEFPALRAEDVVDRLVVQHEALTAYARERGIDPRVEGRISRHAAGAEGHAGKADGDGSPDAAADAGGER